jgi:hypothetical protein
MVRATLRILLARFPAPACPLPPPRSPARALKLSFPQSRDLRRRGRARRIFEGLAMDFEGLAAELGEFVHEEDAVVRDADFAGGGDFERACITRKEKV